MKFAGEEVPKSPFSTLIEGKSGDASQCRAHGPGIEPIGVMVDKPTWFEIDATSQSNENELTRTLFLSLVEAGNGLAEVVLVDPRNRKDVVPVSVRQTSPGIFRCEYVPREPGQHSVNIIFAGRPIPNSPYGVNVSSCMLPSSSSFESISLWQTRRRQKSKANALFSTSLDLVVR